MPTYRVELASSGRAGCKGPKPCGKDNKIPKGELRFGTMVTINEKNSWAWRHWGCVTERILTTLKEQIEGDFDQLDGYEDLTAEEQDKIKTAVEEGHVADEDIPESARKPPAEDGEEEGEDSPKKKKAPAKKRAPKAKKEEEDGEHAEEKAKPKRKRAAPKKAKKEEVESEEEVVPKKRGRKAKAQDDDDE